MALATPAALAAFREGDRVDLAIGVATFVGLVATAVHPAGLVVGGALVGLVAPTLPRALVLGLGVGVAVLVAWGALLLWFGTLLPVAAAAPLVYVAVGSALGLPALSAVAVRGLV